MANRHSYLNDHIEEVHDYNLDFTNRHIYLHGTDDKPEIDNSMANMFLKNIFILEKSGTSPIIIHLTGIGGDWDCGMLIYDAIKNSRCHIIGLCHGSVMSMDSIILQATDERVSMPNCIFMLHEGSDSVDGTYKQAQSYLNIAPKRRQNIIDIYANRFVYGKYFTDKNYSKAKTKAHIKSTFSKKEDWYLTAQEALHYGVIDNIIGDKKDGKKDLYELIYGTV